VLEDDQQALIYLMILRKDFLKGCIFVFHHREKLGYMFVMCFGVVLVDETAIEEDIFGDI
jgi:hypothetical protein